MTDLLQLTCMSGTDADSFVLSSDLNYPINNIFFVGYRLSFEW